MFDMTDTREYAIVKDYIDTFFEGLYTDDEVQQVAMVLYDSMNEHIATAMQYADLPEREVD